MTRPSYSLGESTGVPAPLMRKEGCLQERQRRPRPLPLRRRGESPPSPRTAASRWLDCRFATHASLPLVNRNERATRGKGEVYWSHVLCNGSRYHFLVWRRARQTRILIARRYAFRRRGTPCGNHGPGALELQPTSRSLRLTVADHSELQLFVAYIAHSLSCRKGTWT
jgi:hypothetical protein